MKTLQIGFVLSLLSLPAWATTTARPGTLNYVEGNVSIGSKSLSSSDMGKTEVSPGQVIETHSGKAELLLTPGTLLRVGSNSSVRMISPGLTDTRVQVLRGRAMVESSDLGKNSDIRIATNGSSTRLKDEGIYEFDADSSRVRVFDGKVDVYQDDQKVELKKGKEAQLTSGPLKAEKFDRKEAEQTDDLYRWSSARSEYLAKANESSVRAYAASPSTFGWYGNGWYWNPWFSTWSYLPGNGLLYSPFGYGFYSPRYYYTYPRTVIVPRTRVIVPRSSYPATRSYPGRVGMRRGR